MAVVQTAIFLWGYPKYDLWEMVMVEVVKVGWKRLCNYPAPLELVPVWRCSDCLSPVAVIQMAMFW